MRATERERKGQEERYIWIKLLDRSNVSFAFEDSAERFGSNYSSKAQVASTSVNKRSKRAGRTVRSQRCVRSRFVIASKTRTGVQSARRDETGIFFSL